MPAGAEDEPRPLLSTSSNRGQGEAELGHVRSRGSLSVDLLAFLPASLRAVRIWSGSKRFLFS